MNKVEFFEYLRKKLRRLGRDNVEDAVKYYDEIICEKMRDGMSEHAAILSLGDPKTITSEIASEMVATDKVKNPYKGISLIMGTLMLSPLLFPLALVALTLYIVVFSLWIALLIGFGGGAFAFVSLGITTLFSPTDIGSKFVVLGVSLIAMAVFVLLCVLVSMYGIKLIDLITIKLVRKVRNKSQKGEA